MAKREKTVATKKRKRGVPNRVETPGAPGSVMALILRPNGAVTKSGPTSYAVELPDRAMAAIDHVDGTGWELTIRSGAGQITPRGLFRTPQDILAVLQAEYRCL